MPELTATSGPAVPVGAILLTSLEALLAIAAAHLGEPWPGGEPEPAPLLEEAWLALYAAGGMLDQLAPLLSEDVLVPYRAGVSRLVAKFAEEHADFSIPGLFDEPQDTPVASLEPLAAAMLAELAADDEPPRAGTAPLYERGLPRKGSSPLFPG